MYFKRLSFPGLAGILALGAGALIFGAARAQDTSNVNQAFQVARTAIKPALQHRVVSVYGIGNPAMIEKWYIIFYDPTTSSHGRVVLVQNGAIARTYPANGGAIYSSKLTFDPSRITNEQPALNAAQNYASRHNIAYDSVHALLKETAPNRPFRWRIELFEDDDSRGFVYINALDDTVAKYSTPAKPSAGKGTGTAATDAEDFGNDVKNTFLGIGGDLQEFFTGERTVDR